MKNHIPTFSRFINENFEDSQEWHRVSKQQIKYKVSFRGIDQEWVDQLVLGERQPNQTLGEIEDYINTKLASYFGKLSSQLKYDTRMGVVAGRNSGFFFITSIREPEIIEKAMEGIFPMISDFKITQIEKR
jgi:hypothetical protein